ncbi:MAG: protein tyrosine kinase, partial [Pseudomonadota bacterium]|nr:protein tyrosine kinase [Pseudomonadota bacterium]
MSVVEKAIRKLQESQASGAAAPPAGTTPAAPNTGGAAASAQPQGEKIVIERGTLRAAGLLPPEADMPMLARQYR